MLFEQEKVKLAETQHYMQLMKNSEQRRKEYDDIVNEWREMNDRIDIDSKKRIAELAKMELEAWLHRAAAEIEESEMYELLEFGFVESSDATIEPPAIICQCPAANCRGFILKGHKYTCGICASKICKQCHMLVDKSNHECKPEDIETVTHIKKNCKHCPGCGVLSRKTEGCSQVWCLVCHKAWNWDTGAIETGRIHATDYLNYMRKEGRPIPRADDPRVCGDDEDIVTTLAKVANNVKDSDKVLTHDVKNYLTYRYQLMAEYEFNLNNTPRPPSNLDIRVKYLANEITETRFKQLLHKLDKEYVFKKEIHAMMCAYTVTIREALIQLGQCKSLSEVKKNIQIIRTFQDVMEEQYIELARVFMSKRMCPFRHHKEPALRA